jgi:hypothetical protein
MNTFRAVACSGVDTYACPSFSGADSGQLPYS